MDMAVTETWLPARGIGVVRGGLRGVLRLEALALLALSVFAYQRISADWRLFAILFLTPDLAFLAFFGGPRVGAFAYNLTHSLIGPALLLGAGMTTAPELTPFALIWFAHVGFDRFLGYGLKYGSAFGDTHLGRTGRPSPSSEG